MRISTKERQGFDKLTDAVNDAVFGKKQDFIIPLQDRQALQAVRKKGVIYREEWLDDGIHLTARIRPVHQAAPELRHSLFFQKLMQEQPDHDHN